MYSLQTMFGAIHVVPSRRYEALRQQMLSKNPGSYDDTRVKERRRQFLGGALAEWTKDPAISPKQDQVLEGYAVFGLSQRYRDAVILTDTGTADKSDYIALLNQGKGDLGQFLKQRKEAGVQMNCVG